MSIKILQQNISKFNNRVKELMDILLGEKPQILFLSEFHYLKHDNEIIKRLKGEDYSIVMPMEYNINHDNDNSCSCMMALKDGITFKSRRRNNIILS